MNKIYFSSEDFLEDVKFQIKTEYKNQSNFAKVINYSRKALNKVLNSGDEITICKKSRNQKCKMSRNQKKSMF